MKRTLTSNIFLLLFLIALPLVAAQKMAVVTKAAGDLLVKSPDEKKFSRPLKIGAVLSAGDEVQTGRDGFVVIVFLDDKSQVKLYENCTLEINGKRNGRNLDKNMGMGFGKLKAEVSRQTGTEFKIATPTSVASVKGTDFWMISDEKSGDQIIGLSGIVELLNQVSGQIVSVGSNQTGASLPNGSTALSITQPENIPEDTDENSGDAPEQLRFEYQDANGNIREVIIDYR